MRRIASCSPIRDMVNIRRSDVENVRINAVFRPFSTALRLRFVLTQIGEWEVILHMICMFFVYITSLYDEYPNT